MILMSASGDITTRIWNLCTQKTLFETIDVDKILEQEQNTKAFLFKTSPPYPMGSRSMEIALVLFSFFVPRVLRFSSKSLSERKFFFSNVKNTLLLEVDTNKNRKLYKWILC